MLVSRCVKFDWCFVVLAGRPWDVPHTASQCDTFNRLVLCNKMLLYSSVCVSGTDSKMLSSTSSGAPWAVTIHFHCLTDHSEETIQVEVSSKYE